MDRWGRVYRVMTVVTSQMSCFHSIVSIPPEFVLIQVPNDDLLAIIAEIELTRNTLAEVQALRLEIGVTDLVFAPTEPEVSEDSLTSQQWLQVRD